MAIFKVREALPLLQLRGRGSTLKEVKTHLTQFNSLLIPSNFDIFPRGPPALADHYYPVKVLFILENVF